MTDFYDLHTQLLRIAVDLVEEHNLPGTGRDLAGIAAKLRDAYTEQAQEIAEHRDAATAADRERQALETDYGTIALAIEDYQRGWLDFAEVASLIA